MRRTISGVLLAIFLLTVIPLAGARTAEAADYSNVRVLLSIGSVNTLTIPISGSYFVQENGASFKNGTLTVQVSGSQLVVSHSSSGELYRGNTVQIMRENIDPSAGYFRLATSGVTRTFLGHLTLKYSGGAIRAINTVPLPHYLYGVVAYEMSNTFPAEALKAQAIAAKCYVLANMTGSSDYDIGDTASDQVYKGYNSSYTYVMNAVDSTYNVGLYLGSKILCSYFAASNGGATILPSDAWSGSNRYQWDKAYDRREDPYDVANPYSVQETVFFPKSGESGMTAALSNYLRIRAGMVLQGAGYIDGSSVVVAINSIDSFKLKNSATAEIAMSVVVQLSDGTATVMSFQYSFDINELVWNGIMTKPNLRLFTIAEDRDGYYVSRGRYGHGVGLSQRGAQQMANSGWNYEKILKFYYPGATIKSMGLTAPTNPTKPADTTQPGGTSGLGTPIATAVTTANVNFRAKASASSTLLGTLPKGLALNVYAQESGFSLTEVNGVAGYVSNSYLKITPVSSTPEPTESAPSGNTVVAYGVVNSSTLNFRAQPNTSGKILAKLTKGNVVNIYGYVQNSTWYYCNANGVDGYASAQYITLTGTPDTSETPATNTGTPVVTPENAAPVSGTIATVTESEIVLRTNPSTSKGSVIAKIREDTQLLVLGQSGSYYAVEVNDLQGYISKDGVTLSSGSSTNNTGGTGGNTGAVSGTGATTASANFRKGPGTNYDAIKTLSKGTKLTVLALENGWYKVDVNGTTGYISKAYVTLDATSSESASTGGSTDTATGTGTTTGSVNFRKGPGTNYDAIKKLSKGTKLTIYSLENGWYKADAGGTLGYVSKDYVKLDSGTSGSSVGTGSTWIGEVYKEWVRMRSTPDLSSQTNIMGDYQIGTQVTIIAQTSNGFYQVVVNGVTGYMHKDYVKIIGEAEAASTASGTTTANVYLRAKASSTGAVLTTIPKGSALSILGSSGEYYQAQYGSLTGYLVKKYVSVR
ncbi:MAG TPA: SH3 domain-containing protein [Feifaniaceae bacterium]|nr:SH3 domain-containing protein [Feifaniaceae bacterium]